MASALTTFRRSDVPLAHIRLPRFESITGARRLKDDEPLVFHPITIFSISSISTFQLFPIFIFTHILGFFTQFINILVQIFTLFSWNRSIDRLKLSIYLYIMYKNRNWSHEAPQECQPTIQEWFQRGHHSKAASSCCQVVLNLYHPKIKISAIFNKKYSKKILKFFIFSCYFSL